MRPARLLLAPLCMAAAMEPITPVPIPPDLDPAKLALGERLFQDPRLSHDNTRSCATCHDIKTNGAGSAARDAGLGGLAVGLNTPTVFNAALSFRLNWEGNVRSLDEHARTTLGNPAIMGSSPEEAAAKLAREPEMVRQFRAAYQRDPDAAGLLDALATFQRSLLTPGSRFDRWLEGDAQAITAEELAGYQTFKSLGCIACHQGVNVGGNLHQRRGVFSAAPTPGPVWVRVPSLRNVAVTAPYFHDGATALLQDAVLGMGGAQLGRTLTRAEAALIVAFLGTLTGEYRGRPVSAPPQAAE